MKDIGHNKRLMLDRRRELRIHQTEAERRLWHFLRARRLRGFKFHRQYGVGPYILDFFCFEARLAIELDGGHHATGGQVAYDAERTAFLSGKGIRVLRYWNNEVMERWNEVLEAITSRLPLPPLSEGVDSDPPPLKGEAGGVFERGSV